MEARPRDGHDVTHLGEGRSHAGDGGRGDAGAADAVEFQRVVAGVDHAEAGAAGTLCLRLELHLHGG